MAAEQDRIRFFQTSGLAIQDTDAGGTIQFMTAEDQKIHIVSNHVCRQMRYALRSIDNHAGSNSMRSANQLRNGIDRSEHVGHPGDCNNLCATIQDLIQLRQIQLTIRGQRDQSQRCTTFFGKLLPRYKVGMMLHHGCQDFVTGLNVSSSPAEGNHIQSDRCAGRKHDR